METEFDVSSALSSLAFMIVERAATQFGRQIRDCNRVGGEQQPSTRPTKWASPHAYAAALPKGSLDIFTSQYGGAGP